MNERRPTRLDLISILVLLQASIAALSLLEVGVAGLTGAPLGPIIVINLAFVVILLRAATGLRRRARRARKTTLWIEGIVVAIAVVDLLLSLFLAQRLLELVPILTRFVIPVFVFRTLRTAEVRSEFGLDAGSEAESVEVAA